MASNPSDPNYLSDQMEKVLVLADIYWRRGLRQSEGSGIQRESVPDPSESLQGTDGKTDPDTPK